MFLTAQDALGHGITLSVLELQAILTRFRAGIDDGLFVFGLPGEGVLLNGMVSARVAENRRPGGRPMLCVCDMFILPESRGPKAVVSLLRALVDFARDSDCDALVWETAQRVPLYEKYAKVSYTYTMEI